MTSRPALPALTAVQQQIESMAIAVAELEALGCAVISASARLHDERALIHVRDWEPLAAWLDARGQPAQRNAGYRSQWLGCSAVFRGCLVIWLTPAPAQAPAACDA